MGNESKKSETFLKNSDFCLQSSNDTEDTDYHAVFQEKLRSYDTLEEKAELIENVLGDFFSVAGDEENNIGPIAGTPKKAFNEMARGVIEHKQVKNALCYQIHKNTGRSANDAKAGLHLTDFQVATIGSKLHAPLVGTDGKDFLYANANNKTADITKGPSNIIDVTRKETRKDPDLFLTGMDCIGAKDGSGTAIRNYNLPGKNYDKTQTKLIAEDFHLAGDDREMMETLETTLSTKGKLEYTTKKHSFKHCLDVEYAHDRGSNSDFDNYRENTVSGKYKLEIPLGKDGKLGKLVGQGKYDFSKLNASNETIYNGYLTEGDYEYDIQNTQGRLMYASNERHLLKDNLKLQGFVNGDMGKSYIKNNTQMKYTLMRKPEVNGTFHSETVPTGMDKFINVKGGGSVEVGNETNYAKVSAEGGMMFALSDDGSIRGKRKTIFNTKVNKAFYLQEHGTVAVKTDLGFSREIGGNSSIGIYAQGISGGTYGKNAQKVVQSGDVELEAKLNDFNVKAGGGAQREIIRLLEFPGETGVKKEQGGYAKLGFGYKNCSLTGMLEHPMSKDPRWRAQLTVGLQRRNKEMMMLGASRF